MSSSSAPFLVLGATGRHGGTGRHVASRLMEEGKSVRVLVRSLDDRSASLAAAGAEVVQGDLRDRASLLRALQEVGAVYFTWPVGAGVVEAAATFASAARELGTDPRVVVMSMGAAHPQSPSPLGRAQWLAEEVMAWAGLRRLVLRVAALFYENLALLHSDSIRQGGRFGNSFGEAEVPWIAGVDAAELGVAALLSPERFGEGEVHVTPGESRRSHAQIAQALEGALGKPVRFEPKTREAWHSELVALAQRHPEVISEAMAAHISAVGEALARNPPPPRPSAGPSLAQLLGRSPLDLGGFLEQHRARFV